MRLIDIKVDVQDEINMLIHLEEIKPDKFDYLIEKELLGFEINGKKYDLHIDIKLYIDFVDKYATVNYIKAILQADEDDYYECDFCYNKTLEECYNKMNSNEYS